MSAKKVFHTEEKRYSFLTAMICIDCEKVWETSRISRPCPRCASQQVVALSRWTLRIAGPQLRVISGGRA